MRLKAFLFMKGRKRSVGDHPERRKSVKKQRGWRGARGKGRRKKEVRKFRARE